MTEPNRTRSIAIIGCGYVGYPLALLLVEAGHTVSAVDTDPDVVARIAAGGNLAHEPGVTDLAERVHATGRLTTDTTLAPADVFIIAVPTPLDSTGRKADLSAVEQATRSVASLLEPGNLVIVESTVPPGTTEGVVARLLGDSGLKQGTDFHLAHCPERAFPGNTLNEMREVPRVVGGIDDISTKSAEALLATFVTGTITKTNATTAELVKLMENTYRDVNIALANQVGDIAGTHRVDPAEAIRIANQHPRVDYLDPGIGVGGHCIPIDPLFLIAGTEEGGVIDAARGINDTRPEQVAEAIVGQLGSGTRSVLLLGAAYKSGVADIRNSSAIAVAELLERRGYRIEIYDPYIPRFQSLSISTETAVLLLTHGDVLQRAVELQSAGIEILDATTGIVKAWVELDG